MRNISVLFALVLLSLSIFAQNIPRPEYPRPQFEREEWVNLNGEWSYTFDGENSGKERGWVDSEGFDEKILVPFCPESELSGIGHTDFIPTMWYQRELDIPADWNGKNIMLNFGGVDYTCEAYIDGQFVGSHSGGTSAFSFDLTNFVKAGFNHNLVLFVKDDVRSMVQPLGKQAYKPESSGARYTRTTGIWQTVWMEPVSKTGLEFCRIVPSLDQKQFIITPEYFSLSGGEKLKVEIKDGDKIVSQTTIPAGNATVATLTLENVKTWSPESPFLYDITLEVLNKDNLVIDRVSSYAGMRKIEVKGNRIYLNNTPYYLRFVLDQGFYPDGIWTAPSDQALKRDIELSMQAGFNGARLHQKIFEPRFHYWADKMGYLVWAEASDWGPDRKKPETRRNLINEWVETVKQRINHPSIIGWTPLNELRNTDGSDYLRFNRTLYNLTQILDPTRPVITASGGDIYQQDIWSIHDYAQDPSVLSKNLTLKNGKLDFTPFHVVKEAHYSGEPIVVGEYGGIKWTTDPAYEDAWGYGKGPEIVEEVYDRMKKLTEAILTKQYISGYCFTQLTNIEQEQNGIYNEDRTPKFDMEIIKAIFSKNPSWATGQK